LDWSNGGEGPLAYRFGRAGAQQGTGLLGWAAACTRKGKERGRSLLEKKKKDSRQGKRKEKIAEEEKYFKYF
jgi:hypothetical protein